MFTIAKFGSLDGHPPHVPQRSSAVTLKSIVAYLCDIQRRKLAPALTPPLSIMSDGPASEHVFAEALSATITCLHCGKENLLGFCRKELGWWISFTESYNLMQESQFQYLVSKSIILGWIWESTRLPALHDVIAVRSRKKKKSCGFNVRMQRLHHLILCLSAFKAFVLRFSLN